MKGEGQGFSSLLAGTGATLARGAWPSLLVLPMWTGVGLKERHRQKRVSFRSQLTKTRIIMNRTYAVCGGCNPIYLGRGTKGGARRRQAIIGCCWEMGVARAGGSSAWTILPEVVTWRKEGFLPLTVLQHAYKETRVVRLLTLMPFDLWVESRGTVWLRWKSGGGAFSCLSETWTFSFSRYKTWRTDKTTFRKKPFQNTVRGEMD